MAVDDQRLKFFATARERYQIKLRREQGFPWPWTKDGVFQEYRFCNVHREDDKTTVWFRDNVRFPLCVQRNYLKIVEATVIFRWFNRIETGEVIRDLLLNGWNQDEANRRLAHVKPLVTGAYMIKTLTGKNKLDGILECVRVARILLPDMVKLWGNSLRRAWMDLQDIPYLGPFMAYEVVTDLRWTPMLEDAVDIMSWANLGPGATHGMGRILRDDSRAFHRGSQTDQCEMLKECENLLAMSQNPHYWPADWKQWEMREVEHWLCEYDKYSRGAQGQRLKRRYL